MSRSTTRRRATTALCEIVTNGCCGRARLDREKCRRGPGDDDRTIVRRRSMATGTAWPTFAAIAVEGAAPGGCEPDDRRGDGRRAGCGCSIDHQLRARRAQRSRCLTPRRPRSDRLTTAHNVVDGFDFEIQDGDDASDVDRDRSGAHHAIELVEMLLASPRSCPTRQRDRASTRRTPACAPGAATAVQVVNQAIGKRDRRVDGRRMPGVPAVAVADGRGCSSPAARSTSSQASEWGHILEPVIRGYRVAKNGWDRPASR